MLQHPLLVAGLIAPSILAADWQSYQAVNRTPSTCPDYTTYAQTAHAPYSNGSLKLPTMRPSPECRTFNSSAVEASVMTR
jgi:hypothetical protein